MHGVAQIFMDVRLLEIGKEQMELQRFETLALSNTMANGLKADSTGQLNTSAAEQRDTFCRSEPVAIWNSGDSGCSIEQEERKAEETVAVVRCLFL